LGWKSLGRITKGVSSKTGVMASHTKPSSKKKIRSGGTPDRGKKKNAFGNQKLRDESKKTTEERRNSGGIRTGK